MIGGIVVAMEGEAEGEAVVVAMEARPEARRSCRALYGQPSSSSMRSFGTACL